MRSIASLVIVLALLVLGLASCKDDKNQLRPDPEFSINVLATPDFWPRDDKDFFPDPERRQQQEEAIAERGHPDYLRFVWKPDRSMARHAEIKAMMERRDRVAKNLDIEWVYIDRREVLRFRREGMETRALDDRLEATCLYGDPNMFKVNPDASGQVVETYIYYNEGKMYYFLQDSGKKLREEPLNTRGTGYMGRM